MTKRFHIGESGSNRLNTGGYLRVSHLRLTRLSPHACATVGLR